MEERMKPTKIEFTFDDAKLEAIKLFMKEKEICLEEELDHFMDGLYKKYVPQPVRDFIEKRESEASQVPAGKKAKQRKGVATGEAVCGVSAEG
jgi:hypothetical protein